MKVAELFVNLGVKGGEKSAGVLSNVKKQMGDLKSISLETKAAIVAVVYGLEKMMSASAKNGMELQQFANFTGMSTDMLQRWQYMARQSGVAADEMSSGFKNVQMAMDKMRTGQGAPIGFQGIARSLELSGSSLDVNKAITDTKYMMEKLREYARTTKDSPARANDWLQSFGLGEGTIQMLRTSKIELDKINPRNIYSSNEVGRLAQVDVAWKNLGNTVEKAFGHFTSKHGLGIINDINKLVPSVLRLADAFTVLAEKLKVFALIGKVFEGWAAIFGGMSNSIETATKAGDYKSEKGGTGAMAWIKDAFHNDFNMVKGALGGEAAIPNYGSFSKGNGKTEVNVNQTLQFQHDGKDHKKTGDSVKKAVKDAHRQYNAQLQGS